MKVYCKDCKYSDQHCIKGLSWYEKNVAIYFVNTERDWCFKDCSIVEKPCGEITTGEFGSKKNLNMSGHCTFYQPKLIPRLIRYLKGEEDEGKRR